MAQKEIIMKLKVDLHCEKSMKKVRRVLCKFPEIREQSFNEKQNLVIIKVVCNNPEKIRDKICCKSEGSIKTIEIIELKKQGQPSKPKTQTEQEADKKGNQALTSESPTRENPKREKDKRHVTFRDPLEEELGQNPNVAEHKITPPGKLPLPPPPVLGYPPLMVVPIGTCCVPWYDGRLAGPCSCFHGYGRPSACHCGCFYGRPVYDSYGGGR